MCDQVSTRLACVTKCPVIWELEDKSCSSLEVGPRSFNGLKLITSLGLGHLLISILRLGWGLSTLIDLETRGGVF
jgi:hypothetical protein